MGGFQGVPRAAQRWWKIFAGKNFRETPDIGCKKMCFLLSCGAVSCTMRIFIFKCFEECLSRHEEDPNLRRSAEEKCSEKVLSLLAVSRFAQCHFPCRGVLLLLWNNTVQRFNKKSWKLKNVQKPLSNFLRFSCCLLRLKSILSRTGGLQLRLFPAGYAACLGNSSFWPLVSFQVEVELLKPTEPCAVGDCHAALGDIPTLLPRAYAASWAGNKDTHEGNAWCPQISWSEKSVFWCTSSSCVFFRALHVVQTCKASPCSCQWLFTGGLGQHMCMVVMLHSPECPA